MPGVELYANNASTLLTNNLNNTDVIFQVDDGTLFPVGPGFFRVKIDNEILLISAVSHAGIWQFSATRGVEGTTAASHNAGATITLILTAQSIVRNPLGMNQQGQIPYLGPDGLGQSIPLAFGPGTANQISYIACDASSNPSLISSGMISDGDIEYLASGIPATLSAPADGTYVVSWTSKVPSWTPASQSNTIPTGTILPFAGTAAPNGYFLCDGSAINRSTYASLFSVIGTTYGVGNGTTTFNIPDMRGKFPFGKATAGTGSTLGNTFGVINHTHTSHHDHTFTTNVTGAHTHGVTSIGTLVEGGASTAAVSVNSAGDHSHTGTVDPSDAVSDGNNPPALTINYIIKT